ncbi:MAG: exodeoxyribonuclease VII small subunit [Clostridia bacterium]|nr:exodeoxyribonuclease VII small subunit [Clostridia bacterium]
MEFEEKLGQLEEVAKKLESGSVGLEEGIELYRQSLDLTKDCLQALELSKGKLTVLKQQMDALFEQPIDEDELQ